MKSLETPPHAAARKESFTPGASPNPGTGSTQTASQDLAGRRPMVSFLVLGYNQESFTRAAVEGAFAQTYQPLEIILSDDCSSDRTFEVMREMAEAYDGPHRVILNRNDPNLGIVGHVNRLMEISKGELIVKNDGDDISLPHRSERIAEAWEASGRTAKSFYSAVERMDEAGRAIHVDHPFTEMARTPSCLAILKGNLSALGASSAWSREIFDVFGPIDAAAVGEDTIIPFRASVIGSVNYIDEPLVRYRVGGMSDAEKGRSYGYNRVYGQRLQLIRIHIGTKTAVLKDLDKVSFAQKSECAAECRKYIREREFQLKLAGDSLFDRMRSIPTAMALSLRNRAPVYMYLNLKYMFSGVSIFVYNIRRWLVG